MASSPEKNVRTVSAAKYIGWIVLACWGSFWLWFYLNLAVMHLRGRMHLSWTDWVLQFVTPLAILLIILLAFRFVLIAGVLLVLFGEASTLIITYGAENYLLLLVLPLPALVAGMLFLIHGASHAAQLEIRREDELNRLRTLSSDFPRGRFR